jgi:hypothetical protein
MNAKTRSQTQSVDLVIVLAGWEAQQLTVAASRRSA